MTASPPAPATTPVDVDLDNIPSIHDVRAIPDLDQRAATTGAYSAALRAKIKEITDSRVRAALSLHQHSGWRPAKIYHELGLSRRTFTSWQQRVEKDKRKIPRLSSTKALETAADATREYDRLNPLLEEYQKLSAELFPLLLAAGRSNSQISRLLHLTPNHVRGMRSDLRAEGKLKVPVRMSNAQRVYDLVVQRILDGTYSVGSKLPGEWQVPAELGVHRSAATQAYKRLAKAGVVRPVAKSGWYIEKMPDVSPAGDTESPATVTRTA